MKTVISVGGRFHAFYLARYLTSQGLLHQLITSYPKFVTSKDGIESRKVDSVISKELMQRGFKKIFGKAPSNYFLNEWFDKRAAKKIKQDADIYIIWAGFALHTIKRIRKINPDAIIIIERGSAHIKTQADLLEKAYKKPIVEARIIEKEIKEYDLADYISIPGKFSKKSFIEQGIQPEKLIINNYGVDLSEFMPTASKKQNAEFTLGYAGGLNARKNIVGMIKAVRILNEKGKKVKLKLIGPIDEETFDKSLINQYSFVEYSPPVPQNELIHFYNSLDCFVLNSIEDGFGMVVLQAMACGLPIIATTNSGGPDAVSDGVNGFIIPIERTDILAQKIDLMYGNPKLTKEMGKNSLERISHGFTWDDYGNRAVENLKNIFNSRP